MSGDIHTKHSGIEDLNFEEEKPETNYLENCEKDEKCVGIEIHDKKVQKEQDDDKIILPDGDLFCNTCNIKVTSTKILQRHLEGRRHKARVERRGKTFYCEICDIKANSEAQLNIHLTSSKHKAKVARNECKEFTDFSKTSAGIYILIFCAMCIFLNLIIMLKVGF